MVVAKHLAPGLEHLAKEWLGVSKMTLLLEQTSHVVNAGHGPGMAITKRLAVGLKRLAK